MPMYEYQCTKCEGRFEELVSNQEEEADLACPACGSTKIFRVVTSFSVGHCGEGGSAGGPGCAGKSKGFSGGFS